MQKRDALETIEREQRQINREFASISLRELLRENETTLLRYPLSSESPLYKLELWTKSTMRNEKLAVEFPVIDSRSESEECV